MFAAFLLSFLLIGAPASADTFWKNMSWNTRDGVRLVGLYHPARQEGALTWVLLHGLGSSKGEWDDFARKLAAQGSGVLIYDARGHAESVQEAGGAHLDYRTWQSAGPGTPWDAMPSDLSTAVRKLAEMGIAEKRIAVGGASLGANVALVYASQHPVVPALILLSPGMEYAGISSPTAYQAYQGRPVFIAASPGDLYAYSSVKQLADLVSSPVQTVVEGKGGHGVQMFKDEEFTNTLLKWMKGQHGNRNRRPS